MDHVPTSIRPPSSPWLDLLAADERDLPRFAASLLRHARLAEVLESPRLTALAILADNRLVSRTGKAPALSPNGAILRLHRMLAPVHAKAGADLRGAMEMLSRRVEADVACEHPARAAPFWRALSELARTARTAPLAASLLLESYLHPPPWAGDATSLLPAQEFFAEVSTGRHHANGHVAWPAPADADALRLLARAQADWLLALGLGFAATNYWQSPFARDSAAPGPADVAWLQGPAWEGFVQEALPLAQAQAPVLARIVRAMPADLQGGDQRSLRFDYVLAAAATLLQQRRLRTPAAPAGSRRRV